MCLASSAQKDAAKNAASFSRQMTGQASQIFGNTNQVFNNLLNSYQNIVAGGSSQEGFTQAELNAMNSQAINNNAAQFRNVAGAAKAGQAGVGGGNANLASGATTAQNQGIAEAAAANTANQLGQITQADYATGRQNYFQAAGGETQLPGMFVSANSAGQVANNAAQTNMQAQNAVASANNWWTQPVMGLVNAAGSMATGGLMGMANGGQNQESMSPNAWANNMQSAGAMGLAPTIVDTSYAGQTIPGGG